MSINIPAQSKKTATSQIATGRQEEEAGDLAEEVDESVHHVSTQTDKTTCTIM